MYQKFRSPHNFTLQLNLKLCSIKFLAIFYDKLFLFYFGNCLTFDRFNTSVLLMDGFGKILIES